MSRSISTNAIANLIFQAAGYTMNNNLEAAVAAQLQRFTYGLTDYERLEVAHVVDARIAVELHRRPG